MLREGDERFARFLDAMAVMRVSVACCSLRAPMGEHICVAAEFVLTRTRALFVVAHSKIVVVGVRSVGY